MKAIFRILFVLLVTGALLGCDSRKELTESQIIGDFIGNPSVSVVKYKELWGKYGSNSAPDERFAMASELMDFDSGEYGEYYGFILENLKNKDGTYNLAAIRALRNAKGIESIRLLFAAYESGQISAAKTAADIIKIRHQKTKGVPSLRAEREFIESNVSRMQGPA